MKIENRFIKDLKMYENNPRNNDEAVVDVAKSIKEYGFKVPMVIDKNNIIVCGHTRYKACLQLGIEQVPCVIADDLTDEQITAFRIVENKTNETATWDAAKLYEELQKIDALDLSDFDLDEEFAALQEEDVEEVDVPEPQETPSRVKAGDVWQLGRHRLMVGDSTDENCVKKLMNGQLADLCVTDPPYNVDYTGKSEKNDHKKISNDKMCNSEFTVFLQDAFKNMKECLKPGASFYIWCASQTFTEFIQALKDNGLEQRQQLIWVKNIFVLGRQDYQWRHEPCIYGWKEGTHYFINTRRKTTVFEDMLPEFNKMKKEELVSLLEDIYSEDTKFSTFYENKPAKSLLHPTMKPVKLIAQFIINSSLKNGVVVDLFGGSGSTLMACEQTHRTCYMMELDTHFADVIIKRWEDFTGETAVKVE